MKSFLLISVCLIVAGGICAPGFLVFSHTVEKVDCVMMMVGGEPGARMRGAEQLIEQGRSEVLLIPAYNKVAFDDETGLGEMGYVKMTPVVDKPVKFMGRSYRVFENTHLEMLKGKKIMDKLGYSSAIIVSSPYHMRRLQLIAWKVFGEDYQIGFTATPFEKYDTLGCFRSWKMFANVGSEYLKIGWFLVYSWFVQIGFTATPFEKYDTLGCFRSWKMFANVGSEYLKIGWFLVYSWFVFLYYPYHKGTSFGRNAHRRTRTKAENRGSGKYLKMRSVLFWLGIPINGGS